MKNITHIERANLPWHTERTTECGLDVPRHPAWTRDEALAKYKELGAQRLAFVVCMTCWNCYARHSTWEADPAACIIRAASGMQTHFGGMTEEKRRFADELRAIALLVAAHREEFDATVQSLSEVVDLKEARRAKRA